MYTRHELIEQIVPILKKYPIKKSALFGSYARGEQLESSDVDLLVECDDKIGLDFFSLWDELADTLNKEISLLTFSGLHEHCIEFRDTALKDAEVFYVQES